MIVFVPVKDRLLKGGVLDYLLVLTLGLGVLVFFCFQSFLRLSWSDELVYTVMGRNIAEGRGIITNFYVPASIAERGYPLGDVHLPGHTFLIAPFFWLIGPKEIAALLPNQISYLVIGLLLCWLGRQAFNRWAGITAAIFFFLFPTVFTYAHSAMSELTFILLSTIYLVVWYKSLVAPSSIDSFLLAIILVAGAIHRETFLIFLPTALYSLWHIRSDQRRKALFLFAVVFLTLMFVVFLPLYQARAPYPHALSDFLDLPGAERPEFLVRNLGANLLLFLPWSEHPQKWVHLSFIFLIIAAGFCWLSANTQQKQLIGFYALTFVISFLILASLYSFVDWKGVRSLLMFVPAGAVILSGFIFRGPNLFKRYGLLLFLLGYFGYTTLHLNALLTLDRQQTYQAQHLQSQMIIEQTQEFQPQTVMANKAFLYGWEAYPVTVIWRVATDPAMAKALEEAIPIDVIVVGEEDKNRLIDGVRQGVFKGNYQLVNEIPLKGQYIFVNADRIQREEQ